MFVGVCPVWGIVEDVLGGIDIIPPNGGPLPSWLNASRASAATYFDATGTRRIAANNVPRQDYDPITLELFGWIREGLRNNAVRSSERLIVSTGDWGVVATGSSSMLPNTIRGWPQTEIVSGGQFFDAITTLGYMATVSGQPVQITIYHTDTGTSGRLRLACRNHTDSTESSYGGVIGSMTSSDTAAGSITNFLQENLGGGLWRITFQFTPNFSNSNFRIRLGPDSSTAGQTCIVCGVQAEFNVPFPSSYIPTPQGASATRVSDIYNAATSSFGFNQSAGTIYMGLRIRGQSNTMGQHFSNFNDGTITANISTFISATTTNIGAAAGGVATNPGGPAQADNTLFKVGQRYQSGNNALFISGTKAIDTPYQNATLSVNQTTLIAGNRHGGGRDFFGTYAYMMYVPVAESDATMQSKTAL